MKKVILLLLLMPYPLFAQIVQNFEQDSINSWVMVLKADGKPTLLRAFQDAFPFIMSLIILMPAPIVSDYRSGDSIPMKDL